MYQDEAIRIAAHIRRTIPLEVAHVVQVENTHPLCLDRWSITCYEVHPPLGGPGMHVQICSIAYWCHLLERWSQQGKPQDTHS